jgi:hypothetical protein
VLAAKSLSGPLRQKGGKPAMCIRFTCQARRFEPLIDGVDAVLSPFAANEFEIASETTSIDGV